MFVPYFHSVEYTDGAIKVVLHFVHAPKDLGRGLVRITVVSLVILTLVKPGSRMDSVG